jgi:hypothetical protein
MLASRGSKWGLGAHKLLAIGVGRDENRNFSAQKLLVARYGRLLAAFRTFCKYSFEGQR